MALCHVSAGDLAGAVAAVSAALDIAPRWPLAEGFASWLVSGRPEAEGALGDTSADWAGLLPVHDKWPGTSAFGVPGS